MHDWDPIGVQGISGADGEYDSYLMPIYNILRKSRSEEPLIDYLQWMTEYMGLPKSRESLRPIAAILIKIDLSHDENSE